MICYFDPNPYLIFFIYCQADNTAKIFSKFA